MINHTRPNQNLPIAIKDYDKRDKRMDGLPPPNSRTRYYAVSCTGGIDSRIPPQRYSRAANVEDDNAVSLHRGPIEWQHRGNERRRNQLTRPRVWTHTNLTSRFPLCRRRRRVRSSSTRRVQPTPRYVRSLTYARTYRRRCPERADPYQRTLAAWVAMGNP